MTGLIQDGISADAGTPHSLLDVRATTGQYLDAGVDDLLLNSPVATINRFMERTVAGGRSLPEIMKRPGFGAGDAVVRPLAPTAPIDLPRDPVPMLSPDEANRQYGDLGLKFDAPVAAKEAQLLADTKKRELAGRATFQAARADAGDGAGLGLGRAALSLGVDLVGSMADPINFAALFLPIVGPEARALLALNLGRTGGAVAAGAIEGAVGTALVQPLITGGAIAEQRDASWWDAATNVVLGGVLGGGLHGVTSFLGERSPLPSGRTPPAAAAPGAAGPRPLPLPEGGPAAPRFGAYAGGWRAALDTVGQPAPADLGAWARLPVFDREAPMVRALDGVSPETRRLVGTTALDQVMGGKPIDVEPLLGLDPAWRSPIDAGGGLLRVTAPLRGVVAADRAKLGEGLTLPELRDKAMRFYRDELEGRTIVNEATGREIILGAAGRRRSVTQKGEDLLHLVPELPELLRTGKPIGAPVADARGRADVVAIHRLRAEAHLDGNEFGVILTLREMRDGTYHYTLNKENPGKGATGGGGSSPPRSEPPSEGGGGQGADLEVSAGGSLNMDPTSPIGNQPFLPFRQGELAQARAEMRGPLEGRLEAMSDLRDRTARADAIGDPRALEAQTRTLTETPVEHAQTNLALAEADMPALTAEARQAIEAHPELKAELEAAELAAKDADLFGKAADALAGCKIAGGQ